MRPKWRNWNSPVKKHRIYLILVFLLTGVALYFSLPQEARFRYEYQKGRPWMHASLFAPYNFAIVKSEQELSAEKDSLLSDFVPYLIHSDSVSKHEMLMLAKNVEKNVVKGMSPLQQLSLKLKLNELYGAVYETGILDQNYLNDPGKRNNKRVKIVFNNTGKEVAVSSLYSLKSAYNEIHGQLDDLKASHPEWRNFIEDFHPETYLSSNLFYDQERSSQTEKKLLESLSVNHGLIQEGERIISQGDIVSTRIFTILESLRLTYEKNRGEDSKYNLVILGRIILIMALLLTVYLFLRNIRRKLLRSKRDISFVLITMSLMIGGCAFVIRTGAFDIYMIPFTVLALIIRTFVDTRVAIFVNTITSLIVGFMVPNGYEFVLIQIPVGSVAVISLNKMQKREQLIVTALIVFISYCVIYLGISLVQEANFGAVDWIKIRWFAVNAILTLITYLLMYILEKSFGFVSDLTLIELTFSNQKLLKKLSLEAPGTLHHSLQVANLAEMAVAKIGGNPLLVRAGALYHDIGKMVNPLYFIENQTPGINPHEGLTEEESAATIISHVEDGVALARKEKLPEQIIDFINTHHGTTRTGYFYQKAVNRLGIDRVDGALFSYPGPLPTTRETAVFMLADSIEAASRSLPVKNSETIRNLVDQIFKQKMESGQLEFAPLTFKDIRVLKDLFHEKLINIYHVRVYYPEIKNR
ncbi:MAG: HDIG domain-containing protein [Marinilabiliales bacterium]|nr:HDIG domain-containing protein [Marinilabiliales bacterium]